MFRGLCLDELKHLDIEILDIDQAGPIELLIGVDVWGMLYPRKSIMLQCGLIAIQTTLSWTVMGKILTNEPGTSVAMTTLTLLISDACISNLRDLDVLGITELIENSHQKN